MRVLKGPCTLDGILTLKHMGSSYVLYACAVDYNKPLDDGKSDLVIKKYKDVAFTGKLLEPIEPVYDNMSMVLCGYSAGKGCPSGHVKVASSRKVN